jgi:hypothetical protein
VTEPGAGRMYQVGSTVWSYRMRSKPAGNSTVVYPASVVPSNSRAAYEFRYAALRPGESTKAWLMTRRGCATAQASRAGAPPPYPTR